MTTKVAARVSNFRITEPRQSNDMYAPPPGWQVASYVPPILGRIAQEILSRAVNEHWQMPSEIPVRFEGTPYIARYQIHGPNQNNPKRHPGIGLYERINDAEARSGQTQQGARHIGDKLDNNFFVGLQAMCNRLGCDPKDMLALMHLEAGLDPNVTRPHHGARGLNQMIPPVLKGPTVGWPGTIDQYGQLSAAEQLPWIEKYFRGVMRDTGSGPLRSLPMLYLANFWPAALRNPAVQEQIPTAVIVDENKNPREYEENKGLDVDRDGKITFGDIDKITRSHQRMVASSDVYARMEQATGSPAGYGAPAEPVESESGFSGFLAKIERLLDNFISSASDKHTMTKVALTPEKFLIFVKAEDLASKLEYASVLKTALEEELDAKADVYTDGENVEVACIVLANKEKALDAVKEMCFAISDTFEYATRKIGGVKTQTMILEDESSDYQELDINVAEVNHRKFMLKFHKVGK